MHCLQSTSLVWMNFPALFICLFLFGFMACLKISCNVLYLSLLNFTCFPFSMSSKKSSVSHFCFAFLSTFGISLSVAYMITILNFSHCKFTLSAIIRLKIYLYGNTVFFFKAKLQDKLLFTKFHLEFSSYWMKIFIIAYSKRHLCKVKPFLNLLLFRMSSI